MSDPIVQMTGAERFAYDMLVAKNQADQHALRKAAERAAQRADDEVKKRIAARFAAQQTPRLPLAHTKTRPPPARARPKGPSTMPAARAETARLVNLQARLDRAEAERDASRATLRELRSAELRRNAPLVQRAQAVDKAFARMWPNVDPALADRCQEIVSFGLDGYALMRDGSRVAFSELLGTEG